MEYNLKQLYFATLDYIWDRAYDKGDLLVKFDDIDGYDDPAIEVNIYKAIDDQVEDIIGWIVLNFMEKHCWINYGKESNCDSKETTATTLDEIKSIFDLIDSYKKEDDI